MWVGSVSAVMVDGQPVKFRSTTKAADYCATTLSILAAHQSQAWHHDASRELLPGAQREEVGSVTRCCEDLEIRVPSLCKQRSPSWGPARGLLTSITNAELTAGETTGWGRSPALAVVCSRGSGPVAVWSPTAGTAGSVIGSVDVFASLYLAITHTGSSYREGTWQLSDRCREGEEAGGGKPLASGEVQAALQDG